MTTEHPALFKPEMVREIFAGRKTQTRRLVSNKNFARVKPGDTLWVRETWQELQIDGNAIVAYRAACEGDEFDYYLGSGAVQCIRVNRWRPSIFMPRAYCRLRLLVEAVRVERLQEITVDDIWAEGVDGDFAVGWNKINNKPGRRWGDNPEVRVITFRVTNIRGHNGMRA
jgi:hypothetical protein